MKSKTVLVTGGAGFVGSHLVERLLADGFFTKALDDFSNGNVNNIRALFNHKNFRLIMGDIRNKEILSRAASNVDIIYHLGAQVHVEKSILDPRHTYEVNVLGTLNVLDVARESNVDLVVYASSSEVYGSAKYVPMNEDHPLNPGSPYASSKAAADRLCYAFYNTYKLPVVMVRCFNTYGPRQSDTGYAAAIPIFIRRVLQGMPPIIYGNGTQTRDYMYVNDAVEAYRLVEMAYERLIGKAINFGTSSQISINELANIVLELCGKKGTLETVHVEPRPGEVKRLAADIGLARKVLGFEPKYNITAGVKELVDWYRQGKYEEWKAYGKKSFNSE